MILAKATAPFVLWPAVTWLNQLHASVPTLPTDIHSCWQVFFVLCDISNLFSVILFGDHLVFNLPNSTCHK